MKKLCQCGCGKLTSGKWNYNTKDYVRFINHHQNRNMREEHKKKISIANKGQERSIEVRKQMSLAKKGYKLSKEHKENISIAMRHRKHTWGNQISLGKKGIRTSIKTEFKKGHIFKHSEESKLKIKKARTKQLFPIKDTKIEVKIQNFLKQLGIEFFTHHYMKIEHDYLCDILIPSMNLVIECDGNYWHTYPIGKDIDHIRTKELITKGFKVLRLWEYEINEMSISQFKNKLGEIK